MGNCNVPPWMFWAFAEMGEAEKSGQENNERIVNYLLSVGIDGPDEIPWCSAFVNWVLAQNGMSGTGKGNAKSFVGYGKKAQEAEFGSIVVMNRGKDLSKGHVCFCVGNALNYIYGLGGNQGDKVSIRTFKKDRIVDYRWPI